MTPGPAGLAPRPEPDAAIIAAIAAAVDTAWPRPMVAPPPPAAAPSAWRFSGRWWSQPLSMRRSRPGRH